MGGYEVIPVDQLDLMSPTLKKERTRVENAPGGFIADQDGSRRAAYTQTQVNPRPAAPVNPPNVPTGSNVPNGPNGPNELLQRVVQTKGGLAALKGIRTVVVDADMSVTTPRGPAIIPTKTYVVYPDKFRVDATFAGQQNIQAYNGGSAWVKDPAGVSAAPPAMQSDFAATVRRDTFPLLIAAAEGRLTVRQLPEEGQDGVTLKVLEISGEGLAAGAAVHRSGRPDRQTDLHDAGAGRQPRRRPKRCSPITARSTASRCRSRRPCCATAG